jgi:predicted Rossmann-fold nucleotide-binding protein
MNHRMGVVADSALQAGGQVIGVIPRALVDRELAHPGLTIRKHMAFDESLIAPTSIVQRFLPMYQRHPAKQ